MRNKVEQGSLFLWGILRGLFLRTPHLGNTKRPDMDFRKKFHAAKAANQVVEPEAGRMVECKCAIS